MPAPDFGPDITTAPTGTQADQFAAKGSGPVQGFYINLDRSLDRRRSMERQIDALGLTQNYRRFAAVDGLGFAPTERLTPGEIGLYSSHNDVLAAGRSSGKFIHVLEDDSLLSEFMYPAISRAIERGAFERFDILFTDVSGMHDSRIVKQLKQIFDETAPFRGDATFFSKLRLIDLAQTDFGATSSYIVSPASIDRLLAIYAGEFKRGLRMPLDLFLRGEVNAGRLRAATLFPFLTSIDLELAAQITTGRAGRDFTTVLGLLRYSFFVNRDLDGVASTMLAEILARNSSGKHDRHHEFIMRIMSYFLSN